MINTGDLPDSPECQQCGRVIEWDAKFCASCGSRIESPQEPGAHHQTREKLHIPPWLAKGLALRILAEAELGDENIDEMIVATAQSQNVNSVICWLCVDCVAIAEQYDVEPSEILRKTALLEV